MKDGLRTGRCLGQKSSNDQQLKPHRGVSPGGQPPPGTAGVCRPGLVLQPLSDQTLHHQSRQSFAITFSRVTSCCWSGPGGMMKEGEKEAGQGGVSPWPCSLSCCYSRPIRQVLRWLSSRSTFLLLLQPRRVFSSAASCRSGPVTSSRAPHTRSLITSVLPLYDFQGNIHLHLPR